MRPELKVVVVAAFACASALAATAEEHVGRNLEKGEPARWSQPDDTPQKRAATATREAKAALAEAVKECRQLAADERTACEKQAREQYRLDIDSSRSTR